jgi:hypothetical protein
MKTWAGGSSLHCIMPAEGSPSLRFLEERAAMLPAQLLCLLHYPLWRPSSYRPFDFALSKIPLLAQTTREKWGTLDFHFLWWAEET